MAKESDVIILDEVTSHLSYESEMLIQNAIDEISKDKITIVVAHRLSSIKRCDDVIKMSNGEIIEKVF